jgi:DNA-binding NarL/FixJ family response regulator
VVNPLSEREVEVLRLVVTGATNRQIAATLFIAEGTVRNHLTNILAKLEVGDRTQAAVKAKELGLV